MTKKKKLKDINKVIDSDKVKLNNFKMYKSSDDDNTKLVEGELAVEDFKLYDSK